MSDQEQYQPIRPPLEQGGQVPEPMLEPEPVPEPVPEPAGPVTKPEPEPVEPIEPEDDSDSEVSVSSSEIDIIIDSSGDQEDKGEVKVDQEVESESESESDTSDSDSDSEDEASLSHNIIRDLQNGTYTCLVCTLEIDTDSKVWSCDHCYRVYDMDCIQNWAKRGTSTTSDHQWRCPNCNETYAKVPKKFTCWCGKVENPKPGLLPFSCGNLCNQKYSDCMHKCTSVCHPADHPICGALGPIMNCKCGKFSKQLPCLITPYKTGWRCDEVCQETICDLGHKCPKTCHDGFCGACSQQITGSCYCGKNSITIGCSEKYLQPTKEYVGISYCQEITKKYYECGTHYEEIGCQVPSATEKCKFDPAITNTCYCGNTVDLVRTVCTDPILECDSICNKPLDCGCYCKMKCHSGPCECFNLKTVRCSCQNYEYSVTCKSLEQGFVPKCKHRCDALLNCRKHYHKEECCSMEPVALARERKIKKALRNKTISNVNRSNDVMTIEPIHICYRTCNRLKTCGEHHCSALCHNGPCPPCLEASNDDLVCNCGKTIILAPVRCGTKVNCHEQCIRPKACGHEPETHECHESDVTCPKCTFLVTKTCDCGRKEIPNVLCSGPPPKCSFICKESKDCGHPCSRNCSKDCNNNTHVSSTLCQVACGKFRSVCPHRCRLKCHHKKRGESTNCNVKTCYELVNVTCECGRIERRVPCNSSVDTPSSIDVKLHCDDVCEQIKRDEELKQIFNSGSKEKTPENPEEQFYSDYVLDTYMKQVKWCSNIESFMREFVNNEKKSHHFPVMNKPQRQFVHELAEKFKFYSESQDPEPKRNVFIYKTHESVAPTIRIQQDLEKKQLRLQKAQEEEEWYLKNLQEELFNSILVQDLFLGVSIEKFESLITPFFGPFNINCDVKIVKLNLNYLIWPQVEKEEMSIEFENRLYKFMKYLRSYVRDNSLAFDCKLCLYRDEKILKIDTKVVREEEKGGSIKTLPNNFDLLAVDEGQDEAVEAVEEGQTEQVDEAAPAAPEPSQELAQEVTEK